MNHAKGQMMKISVRLDGEKKHRRLPGIAIYVFTVVLALCFLYFGNKFATGALGTSDTSYSDKPYQARVLEVLDRSTDNYSLDGISTTENVNITFSAKFLDGDYKGMTVKALQNIDGMLSVSTKEVRVGDKVLIFHSSDTAEEDWVFMDYLRTDKLLILFLLFAVALLIFGRLKGVNTILSLALTCGGIFAVFIPSILAGQNIYLCTAIISFYTIVVTLLIINGPNNKSLAAGIGCLAGITISGALTFAMDRLLSLTGVVNEESIYLTNLTVGHTIDLRAIVFAAIVIGSLGAVLDVSISISAALWEIKETTGEITFRGLFNSGLNIGKDIMGTMANTLILAYIGSSLSVALLLYAYNNSMLGLLNKEMIVVEILQALVGSIGILATMPLTSLICAFYFTKKNHEVPLVTDTEFESPFD